MVLSGSLQSSAGAALGWLVPLAAGGSGIERELIGLLTIFVVAAGVGTLVAKVGRFPYTIALLLAGMAVGVVVSRADVSLGIQLSHDLILLVVLPVLLFEGAATTDVERFRRNVVPIALLAVPGLLVSVTLLAVATAELLGYSLLLAALFAAMILPTDPVSVLALFEELGAPDRLSVLVEGESLINDGVGVVLFTTLLALVEEGATASALLDPASAAALGAGIAYNAAGGAVVGGAAGYLVYNVMGALDEQMTEIVLTLVLAYGSFLLAEHLGVSGVIATVAAGLLVGNRGAEYAMSPRTKLAVFNTWDTAAFVVNTFIFVAIGIRIPVSRLLANVEAIAVGVVLVLLARAAVVYPASWLVNWRRAGNLPTSYQHVMVWGGLHASIPIALALGLPEPGSVPGPFPRDELTALVFGIAAFSLVGQGLTMGTLLDRLDVVTRSEAEELYELLTGRARAVKQALDAAERLHEQGDIARDVYEDFEAEYGAEKGDLDDAISALLRSHPELHHEQLLAGERQVLRREKSAITDAVRDGVIADDVGDRLVEEVDLKLDRVRDGESTVREEGEGYTEFWRERLAASDVDLDVDFADDDGEDGTSD